MRTPIILGFAIGCGVIFTAEYAFPKDSLLWHSDDPDLLALEKLNARAKKAMDAFVLRPRIADAYDNVCHDCMRGVAGTPLVRADRASISSISVRDVTSGVGAPLPTKPKFAALGSERHVRRAARLRQKLARRVHRLKRSVRRIVTPHSAETWEAELRR